MSYTVEHYESRPDWMRGTHQSIGASMSAGILGLSSYHSPYSVWVRMTEPLEITEPDELQRWGLLLEPVILAEFNRRACIMADTLEPITVHRSNERPFMHCTLDAIGLDGEPVELKTAHFPQAKIWGKEVPLPYMVQVQHQLYVTGAQCGYIAVLVDGYQFGWHRVPRHDKFIERMLRKLDHFWHQYVVKRQPPPTDFSEATTKALLRKYPTSNGGVIELPDELEPLYEEMKTLTATESAASKRKDEIKNLLRERMGDCEVGYFPSGNAFKWSGENGSRRFTLGRHYADSNA